MDIASSVKTKTKPAVAEPKAHLKALARALLNRTLGLRDCNGTTLDALVAAGQLRSLGKDELFLARHQPFDNLGLVVEGSLEVSLLRHDGHRHLISFLQPGDLTGLMGLVDGLGHANDLRARQDAAVVLVVPGDEVRRLRALDPLLGQAFERQLVFRSRLLYERLAADPSLPLDARLARLLHLLISLHGRPKHDCMLLDMKVSQTDLADWLGVSRQRINFVIQKLKSDGLIALRYSHISVLDPDRLATLGQHGT